MRCALGPVFAGVWNRPPETLPQMQISSASILVRWGRSMYVTVLWGIGCNNDVAMMNGTIFFWQSCKLYCTSPSIWLESDFFHPMIFSISCTSFSWGSGETVECILKGLSSEENEKSYEIPEQCNFDFLQVGVPVLKVVFFQVAIVKLLSVQFEYTPCKGVWLSSQKHKQ